MATILRDYQHAKKLFIADTHQFAPKQSFLYYVCLNTSQTPSVLGGIFNNTDSSLSLQQQYEAGMLVKSVQLPSFNLNTKVVNNYNRKEIIHSKIEYDPINIVFHDDSADLILKFWNDYYTQYYRDSDYSRESYGGVNKNSALAQDQWGFNPRNPNPYLKDIQIFSLHKKRFTEYLLVNPHISNLKHGQHDSSQSIGIMEVSMTVSYETVKYKTGFVNPIDVNGFATLHYDNTESPLGGSFINTQGELGILGAITGSATDLAKPAGLSPSGGVLDSIANTARLFNSVKNANLGSLAKLSAVQIGASALNKALNGGGVPGFPIVNDILGGVNDLAGGIGGSITDLANKAKNLSAGAANLIPDNIVGPDISKLVNDTASIGAVKDLATKATGKFNIPSWDAVSLDNALYSNTSDADLDYTGDDPIVIERINRAREQRGLPPLDESRGGGAE